MGIKDFFLKEKSAENILKAEEQAEEKKKVPSVFRGPGFYDTDIENLTTQLEQIKGLLIKGNITVLDENIKNISAAVLGLVNIVEKQNTEKTVVCASQNKTIISATETGGELPKNFNNNFVKNDFLAEVKNIVNDLDMRLKNRISGIETLLGAQGETKYNPPPPPNRNKFYSGRKPLNEQEFTKRCDEIKKFLEPCYNFVEKSWNLKESGLNVNLWKITDISEAENASKETFLTALVCNSEFDKKRERNVLTELRDKLVKVFGGEKAEVQKTSCVILTSFDFRAETKTINEWYDARVGVFQLESIFYLLPLWSDLKHNFRLAIDGQKKTPIDLVPVVEVTDSGEIQTQVEQPLNFEEIDVETKSKSEAKLLEMESDTAPPQTELKEKEPMYSQQTSETSIPIVESEDNSAIEIVVEQESETDLEQEENYRFEPDE